MFFVVLIFSFEFFCTSQEIGRADHLQNDLYCVERDIEPYLTQPDFAINVSLLMGRFHRCKFWNIDFRLNFQVTLRSHRRRFAPDFENFKIATKSQFILTILVHHSSSWNQIGNQNLSGRKFQHVEIFSPILESVPI